MIKIIKILIQIMAARPTEDHRFVNVMRITGYRKYGISKRDMTEWVDDNGGSVLNMSPLVLEFSTDREGTDSCEIDTFIGWIKEEAGRNNVKVTQQDAITATGGSV